jgi:hypothetical protein
MAEQRKLLRHFRCSTRRLQVTSTAGSIEQKALSAVSASGKNREEKP